MLYNMIYVTIVCYCVELTCRMFAWLVFILAYVTCKSHVQSTSYMYLK